MIRLTSPAAGVGFSLLQFGFIGAPAASTYYMSPGAFLVSTDSTKQQPIMTAGTIRKLRVHCRLAPVAPSVVTFTVRLNGVDTAITCVLNAAGGTNASDLTNSFSVVTGDLVGVKMVGTGAGTFPPDIIASLELS